MILSGSRADALRELRVPTLVIHGLDDTLIDPSGGKRTAELVPGAELLLIPDMGHDRPQSSGRTSSTPWCPTPVEQVVRSTCGPGIGVEGLVPSVNWPLMPKTRQPPSAPLKSSAPQDMPSGAGWLPHGYAMASHTHEAGQLVYAAAGTLATTTERGTWVAPANRVTWTPPGFAHSHRFYGRTDTRLLTVPVELCHELIAHPSVFAVGPLLREAVLALTGDRPETRPGAHQRLLAVVIDELSNTPSCPCICPRRTMIGSVPSPIFCTPIRPGPRHCPSSDASREPASAH